jgi:quercetin dioxygenase-like cupin family protein
MSTRVHSNAAPYVVAGDNLETFDVLGPTIEFLMAPAEKGDSYCIMRGTIAPGVIIPLHSHEDFETFVIVSGELEGVAQSTDGFKWIGMAPGDVFHVPAGAKHAFRNTSAAPAVVIVVSTARMGRFFREIGRPVPQNQLPSPPTPETIQHFLQTAEEYGYWLATAEENAEIGLHMPV